MTYEQALEEAEALREMSELGRARAEIRRLTAILYWTADRWDEERGRRWQLQRELDHVNARGLRLELERDRVALVVGSQLGWLVSYLEAAAKHAPELEAAAERARDARDALVAGRPVLGEREVEDAG